MLQYAHDTCLIINGHSLGIRASSGRSFDPSLTVVNQFIPFIKNNAIKFLGKTTQVLLDTKNVKNQVLRKLTRVMERVGEIPVTETPTV